MFWKRLGLCIVIIITLFITECCSIDLYNQWKRYSDFFEKDPLCETDNYLKIVNQLGLRDTTEQHMSNLMGEKYQVLEDYVYANESGDLYRMDRKGENKALLYKNVSSFIEIDGALFVLYLTDEGKRIISRDVGSEKETVLLDEKYEIWEWFGWWKGQIIYVSGDGVLYVYNEKTGSREKIMEVSELLGSRRIVLSNQSVLLVCMNGEVCMVDPEKKEISSVLERKAPSDDIAVCRGDKVYFSIRSSGPGTLSPGVVPVHTENDGIWEYDLSEKKLAKIREEGVAGIYLFDSYIYDNHLNRIA